MGSTECDNPAPVSDDASATSAAFAVVGVGASAGGLDALEHFFASVPVDCGLGFVVITHTQPGRHSLLPQILARHTAMTIVAIEEAPIAIAPGHVYVAPGGKYVSIHDDVLRAVDMPDAGPRAMPIDHFFRSLAEDRGPYAIGVVLSGTGSDGTIGVREIKGAAGLAVAQEESSARYPSMPRSAAATDLVDHVLPPHEIPERLIEYARHVSTRAARPAGDAAPDEAESLQRIFQLLRRHSGHDFSAYKPSTLRRRVERRMNVHHVATAADYAGFLEANPGELEALFHELLINVTSFFRDPEGFEALERLLPALLDERAGGQPVRVWVPGCSTGEEAYSLAILLRESMERLHKHVTVQMFATDLDPSAIEIARTGVYPDNIAGQVSPERLERFFTRDDGGYRIRKDLREMIVFAPHNVTSDPPFTRLDLLSCRNLLIYLNGVLQARLLPLFHYALRRGGLLMLGSSESVGAFGHLFETRDKKWKLFHRREVSMPGYPTELVSTAAAETRRTMRAAPGIGKPGEASLTSAADRLLFEQLVPPSVLVHESGELVHIHGRTGELLELPAGPVTNLNVLTLAREGLALDLAAALREATLTGGEVIRRGVRVEAHGHDVPIDLRVKKIHEPEPFRDLLLVSFERSRPIGDDPDGGEAAMRTERIVELERELQHGREVHQGVVEELEAANEELKSTNEELQSTNEELQSTNEELETSKEEMQSLNEELQTVNAELQDKLDELSRTNDDMKNLLDSTDIATVFLDDRLHIKRYTEQARRVIPLIPADIGRPVRDLVPRLRYDAFVADAQEVLRTLVFKETEVQSEDGKWYLTRILPYRTTENVIEGLVITFVEITRVRGLQEQSGAILSALARSPTAVFGIDASLRYTWSVTPLFGVAATEAIGKRDADLLPPDAAAALERIKRQAATSGLPTRARVTLVLAGARRTYDLYLEPQRGADGAVAAIGGVLTELEVAPA
jgi:two-component system, chemotaxis family, CheB/CheR fusion protein